MRPVSRHLTRPSQYFRRRQRKRNNGLEFLLNRFRALLMGHKIKGYGLVVMTNASEGAALIQEIGKRVERAYRWDSLDEPVPR